MTEQRKKKWLNNLLLRLCVLNKGENHRHTKQKAYKTKDECGLKRNKRHRHSSFLFPHGLILSSHSLSPCVSITSQQCFTRNIITILFYSICLAIWGYQPTTCPLFYPTFPLFRFHFSPFPPTKSHPSTKKSIDFAISHLISTFALSS